MPLKDRPVVFVRQGPTFRKVTPPYVLNGGTSLTPGKTPVVGAGGFLADGYTVSVFAQSLLDDANAAAMGSTLGLGTAAYAATTAFEPAGAIGIHAAVTSGVHGISVFAASLLDDANAAAMGVTLGLGTAAYAATTAFEASGAVSTHAALTSSVHGITTFAATILDDTSSSAVLTTLGIASLATSGISGALTLSKAGTTARTATFPDAAITVAGSAAALTSTYFPVTTTGGLLQDSVLRQNSSKIGIGMDPTGTEVLQVSGAAAATSFTDGFITWSAAQINRSGQAVELQYASGGNVRCFGAGATPITFSTDGKVTATSVSAGTLTDGFITVNLAQINRTGGAVELQYGCASGVNIFGGTATKAWAWDASTGNCATGSGTKLGIGRTPTTYALEVAGAIYATGAFGCNGATPQGKYTFNAASSDLATVVALCNQIRSALIANGIGQ